MSEAINTTETTATDKPDYIDLSAGLVDMRGIIAAEIEDSPATYTKPWFGERELDEPAEYYIVVWYDMESPMGKRFSKGRFYILYKHEGMRNLAYNRLAAELKARQNTMEAVTNAA